MRIALGFVLAAVALAGCGGGDDTNAAHSPDTHRSNRDASAADAQNPTGSHDTPAENDGASATDSHQSPAQSNDDDPDAGNDGTSSDACYSPTQNLDLAYEPRANGCACSSGLDGASCRRDSMGRYVALFCTKDRWVSGNDGPCGAATDARERLFDSRDKWNELSASLGKEYWYEEENCLAGVVGGGGSVTRVQVEGDSAQISSMFAIQGDACMGKVNRYDSFTAKTFPQLYEECAALLDRDGDQVKITTDAQGVIHECSDSEPGCQDNCGEGFLVRTWHAGKK